LDHSNQHADVVVGLGQYVVCVYSNQQNNPPTKDIISRCALSYSALLKALQESVE